MATLTKDEVEIASGGLLIAALFTRKTMEKSVGEQKLLLEKASLEYLELAEKLTALLPQDKG